MPRPGTIARCFAQHETCLTKRVESFNRALAIDPDFVDGAAFSRQSGLDEFRDYDAALADLESAAGSIRISPYVLGDLLHLQHAWRRLARTSSRIRRCIDRGVRAGKPVVQPFVYQAICESPAICRPAPSSMPATAFPPGRAAADRHAPPRKNPHRICLGRISRAGHRLSDGGAL